MNDAIPSKSITPAGAEMVRRYIDQSVPYNYFGWVKPRIEKLLEFCRAKFPAISKGSVASGDVVVFRISADEAAAHHGVMIDEDRFVFLHAGSGLQIERLSNRWWGKRLCAAFRPNHDEYYWE